MNTVDLEVMARTLGKSVIRELRRNNYIPAVVYGKGLNSFPISVESQKFNDLYKKHGHSAIVNLKTETGDITGIIKEIQYSVPKGDVIHIDFQKISMEDRIVSVVPIRVEGISVVESKGLIVQHQVRELNIRCLPIDIPEDIVIDVSGMKVGDALAIRDLKVPDGVEVLDNADENVLSIVVPTTTETETETETEAEAETETEEKPEEEPSTEK